MYSIKGIEIENEGKLIPGILARWGKRMELGFKMKFYPSREDCLRKYLKRKKTRQNFRENLGENFCES